MRYGFFELIDIGKKFLSQHGVKMARFETMILAEKTLNMQRLEFFTNSEILLDRNQKKKFLKRLFKRTEGRPVSKICGKKEFFSNEFYVSDNVLDPRPESEIVVEVIKKITGNYLNKNLRILDLGTGSGCLLISLFLELKNFYVQGIGIDISESALKIAKKNLKKFDLTKELLLKKSDWFSNVHGKFDIILSNPPYIKTSVISKLQREVRDYDPYISLNGGFDGLRAYREISLSVKRFLNKDGILCFEIGKGQYDLINKIFYKSGFKLIYKEKDLQGIDRVVVYRLK